MSVIFYTLLIILFICIYINKNRHKSTIIKKVKRSNDDFPYFGSSLYFVISPELIMKKLIHYSRVTTKRGGVLQSSLGPFINNYYMITEPTYAEAVLKNMLEKDNLVRFTKPVIGNAMIFAPVAVWRPRRKIAIPAFSPKVIANFVNIFARQSNKLANLLKPMAGAGKFKIWLQINAYNLDSVMETGMGVPLNSQEDHNNTFLTATNEAIRYCCERMFQPWLQPDWLYKLFPQHEKLMQAIKIIHDFTDEVIEKRKALQKCPENNNHTLDQLQNREITFLDILINHGGIHCYSNTELREEVLTFIVAATDTSAVSICFTLKLLAKYPEIQLKVFEEIYSIFGDSERLLEKDDLPKLQYLERVIKETIRLFPPVPFIIRTATEDFRLNTDITIPKGSGVTVSIYGLHRNANVWGSDAENFDPDRFLPERTKGMHPCAYIPFSYGPRNCLGYQYAMMSMKTALSTILRRYRVIGEPENNPVPKIRVKFDIMMKAVDGFEVALELR